MAHSHSHSHDGPAPLGPLAAKIVVGLLAAIGVVVIAGAVLLWPSQQKVDIPLPFQNASGGAVTTEAGHVLSSALGDCGSPSTGQVLTSPPGPGTPGAGQCVLNQIAIDSGPNSGANTQLEFTPGPGQPNLACRRTHSDHSAGRPAGRHLLRDSTTTNAPGRSSASPPRSPW